MELLELMPYATLFFILLIRFILSIIRAPAQLPPSPLAIPIIGHLHLLGSSIHRSFHDLSIRYGPLIHLRLGSVPCVVASTPELAKEFLKNHELKFAARNQTPTIRRLTYNSSFAFAPYGPFSKFVKKLCTTELLGTRTVNQFMPIRTKELHQFIRFFIHKAETREPVNVTEELLKLTNNTISEMMLSNGSSEKEGDGAEARTLAREVTELFGEFNVSDFIWLFRKIDFQGFRKRVENIHTRYDALLEKVIAGREQKRRNGTGTQRGKENVKDVLEVLLDVMESNTTEVKITINHIKALILDFFTAGTDTSATSVEWALAELINNPKVLKKAQEEIEKVVGNRRLVEESDGVNLPYIQAIMKETFRIHPPIPLIVRKALNDCVVNGYSIPTNTLLFVNMWSIGRNPKYWESPLEFRPERFLVPAGNDDQTSLIDIKGQHFELLPFGTGRRGCPGMSLAMQELPIVLAAMIQCFEWKVVGSQGGNMDCKVDMTERPGLTTPRAHDLICIPVKRINPTNILLRP